VTLFRRSPWLVAHWDEQRITVRNCATRTRSTVALSDLALLDALTHWRSLDEIAPRFRRSSRRELSASIGRLLSCGLIGSSDRPAVEAEGHIAGWRDWSPAATLFHFETKDEGYVHWRLADREVECLIAESPPPPPLKQVTGRRQELPAYPRRGALPSVLLARRSWRRFGRKRITLVQLSTLLGLTWGIQKWAHFRRGLPFALKTSPSGGACHSIEVYLIVQRVRGVEPGLYHYCPETHALTRLKGPWGPGRLTRALGGQPWFAEASLVVFMTSVFPRVQWKYRSPRAYRVVLLEAGHFCQTFCLVATWLGLAPFCTAALADTMIERHLRVDGVNESVLYATGVGPRPRNASWAPWWHTRRLPRTTLPRHLVRRAPSKRER
jgi:SagB-type dehydrogenase family enzyme